MFEYAQISFDVVPDFLVMPKCMISSLGLNLSYTSLLVTKESMRDFWKPNFTFSKEHFLSSSWQIDSWVARYLFLVGSIGSDA